MQLHTNNALLDIDKVEIKESETVVSFTYIIPQAIIHETIF